jgi:hypothetical protein
VAGQKLLTVSGGAAAALLLVLALAHGWGAGPASAAPAKPPSPPQGPDAAGPPTTLKAVPALKRVRIEVSPGGAAVTHDLVFAKNAVLVSGPGEPTLFFAFTAQARPLAVEATRHALDDQGRPEGAGTPMTIIDAAVRPPSAALVIGPGNGAGHVVRLPKGDAAFGLRFRSAIPTAAGLKELPVLARLGVRDGQPLPLERVEVSALLGLTLRGARAVLCGPSADGRPMTLVFPAYPASSSDAGTIAPSALKRAPSDDLCVDILI